MFSPPVLPLFFSAGPISGQKMNFSKVWHVGTQNLKLEMLVTTQKSVFNFELPSRRNSPQSDGKWHTKPNC